MQTLRSAPTSVTGAISRDEWPVNRDAIRFLARTAPDARGRQDFYALRWLNGVRYARLIRGELYQHVERARSEDVEFDIVERFGSLREAA